MKKRNILPFIAAAAVLAAALIVFLVPGEKNGTLSPYVERNTDGDFVIRTTDLASDRISFLRIGEESRIELLARKGEDGKAKAALGTCQACNGSPGAYYTQQGDLLKCNNCGLTFPLSVIDMPGGGCHPITIDPSVVTETEDGLILNAEALMGYEYLFEKVASH